MAEPSYEQAVQETADALAGSEHADWIAARHTYERTHRNGRSREHTVPMEQWCRNVRDVSSVRLRFGTQTGYRYAKIWERYGLDSSSPEVNFKDAYREVDGTPDRERMMEYEAVRLLKTGSPALKRETTASLLRDPDVREEAVDVGTALGGTVLGIGHEQRERVRVAGALASIEARERTEREPGLKALDEGQALLDVERACDVFARAVAEALPRVGGLSPDPEAAVTLMLRLSYARARGAVDQVGDLLETGRVGGRMEEWVRSVLAAEGEKRTP